MTLLLDILWPHFFPTDLHSEWAGGCSVSVLFIVEDHEHIVQLSMSSAVYAGGGSGKMDSLAELIIILSE